MNFFNKILTKLGLRKDEPVPTTPAPAPAHVAPAPAQTPAKPAPAKPAPSAPVAASKPKSAGLEKEEANVLLHRQVEAAPVPVAISEVDVVKHLEQLSEGSGLDWKVSIVDLLKLLDIDSSREARHELAVELGCPAELMSDSAKMNTWLHKTVLKKIAENGGNIPQSLLD
jgi:3-oxoacyl-ACP reductase-like protein